VLRVGVLVSGAGTNLQAILDACAAKRIDAQVVVVACDRPEAQALDRARAAGVPTFLVERRGKSREQHDAEFVAKLREARVELVCLAGYMRIVTKVLLEAFPERVVNVHPALLPSFPGMGAQRQTLESGVRIAGCTTHIVDEQVDHGPILMQAAVPVLEDDNEETLALRILAQEHLLYPATVQLFAEGRVHVVGHRVHIDPPRRLRGDEALRNPPL